MRTRVVALIVASVLVAAHPARAAETKHTIELRPVLATFVAANATAAASPEQLAAVASCDSTRVLASSATQVTPPDAITAGGCAVLALQEPRSDANRVFVGPARIDGDRVKRVQWKFTNQYVVILTLTSSGLKRFNQLAAEGFSKPSPQNEVAIVVDGVVLSDPAFQESSFDGPIQISGQFSLKQIRQLVAKIAAACDCS